MTDTDDPPTIYTDQSLVGDLNGLHIVLHTPEETNA